MAEDNPSPPVAPPRVHRKRPLVPPKPNVTRDRTESCPIQPPPISPRTPPTQPPHLKSLPVSSASMNKLESVSLNSKVDTQTSGPQVRARRHAYEALYLPTQFCKLIEENASDLPFQVELCESFHEDNSSLIKGDKLKVYFIKQTEGVLAETSAEKSVFVPLFSAQQCSVITHKPEDTFTKRDYAGLVTFLKSSEIAPVVYMYNETLEESCESGMLDAVGEVLVVRNVNYKKGGKSVSSINCWSVTGNQMISLDFSCKAYFSISPEHTKVHLSDIINHYQFPFRAVFYTNTDVPLEVIITEQSMINSVIVKNATTDEMLEMFLSVSRFSLKLESDVALQEELKKEVNQIVKQFHPSNVSSVITGLGEKYVSTYQRQFMLTNILDDWRKSCFLQVPFCRKPVPSSPRIFQKNNIVKHRTSGNRRAIKRPSSVTPSTAPSLHEVNYTSEDYVTIAYHKGVFPNEGISKSSGASMPDVCSLKESEDNVFELHNFGPTLVHTKNKTSNKHQRNSIACVSIAELDATEDTRGSCSNNNSLSPKAVAKDMERNNHPLTNCAFPLSPTKILPPMPQDQSNTCDYTEVTYHSGLFGSDSMNFGTCPIKETVSDQEINSGDRLNIGDTVPEEYAIPWSWTEKQSGSNHSISTTYSISDSGYSHSSIYRAGAEHNFDEDECKH